MKGTVVNQPANTQLRPFRDAVYHRYQVDPALQRSAIELVEERAFWFQRSRQAWPEGWTWSFAEEFNRAIRHDSDLVRHWAVADLIAAQDARDPRRRTQDDSDGGDLGGGPGGPGR